MSLINDKCNFHVLGFITIQEWKGLCLHEHMNNTTWTETTVMGTRWDSNRQKLSVIKYASFLSPPQKQQQQHNNKKLTPLHLRNRNSISSTIT